jgi:hypothetical protein
MFAELVSVIPGSSSTCRQASPTAESAVNGV